MRRVGVALSLVLALSTSGCFLSPCASNHWYISNGWRQPEIFDAFPPEGEMNGYKIEWSTPEDDSSIVYESRRAEGEFGRNTYHISISERDHEVTWWVDRRALSKPGFDMEEAETQLNESFEALGLTPNPDPWLDWEKKWGTDMC